MTIVTILLCMVGMVRSQPPSDTISWSIDLDDIVVTAQYAPTDSRSSIHDIRIIKRETIERRGANNLEQLLQQETNIRIDQDLVLGSSMSLSGISGQNVKIMIDGVPIIGRQDGNIDLSQINLQNIERVEIVEGPLGVSYGTDALAGVINLISKKTQLKKWSTGLNTQLESRGEQSLAGQLGWRFADKWLLQLNGGRDHFNGYSEDSTRSVLWNPKEQWYGGASLKFQLQEDQHFRYTFNSFREEVANLGEVRRPQFKPYAFDDIYQTLRTDHTLSYEGAVSSSHYLQVMTSVNQYVRYKNTFRNNFEEGTLIQEVGQQDTSRFNAFALRATFASRYKEYPFNFQVGIDLRYDNANGQRIQDAQSSQANFSEISDYALFGRLNYQLNKMLQLESGFRYAYNTKYDAPLVPSIHLKYNWSPAWALRASYGRGFRSPDLKELFFEFIDVNHYILGNPQLKAEKSNNFQLSLQFTKEKKHQLIQLKAHLFYNAISDKIALFEYIDTGNGIRPVTDTTTLQFAYFNQSIYKTRGGDFKLSYQNGPFTWHSGVSLIAYFNPLSATYSEVRPFTNTTEWSNEWQYTLPKTKIQASIFLRWNDRRISFYPEQDAAGNEVVGQRDQDGYYLLDASIHIPFWQSRLKFTGGGKNLLDIQSVQQSGTGGGAHLGSSTESPISPGRNFFIRLGFLF